MKCNCIDIHSFLCSRLKKFHRHLSLDFTCVYSDLSFLRCFETVFQRPYQCFSIALKVFFSLFDRCKIFTSNWLNIHCFDVMLIFPKIMRTIHTSMISTFWFEFMSSFECKTVTILTLKCGSHGYMYSALIWKK